MHTAPVTHPMIKTQTVSPIARFFAIATVSFLTLVDLFAAQAILPSLASAYSVSAAEMSIAVNACTLGMALAGLAVAFSSGFINTRHGTWISLVLLAVPTLLLASMPSLFWFGALRIAQGMCMAVAFSLTMAHLAQNLRGPEIASALAAYVTGNVTSNLVGRLMAGSLVSTVGLEATFSVFALLNLLGAGLAYSVLKKADNQTPARPVSIPVSSNAQVGPVLVMGFLILFIFIGTFTYINFVLARPPFSLAPMTLGLIYFVFAPAIFTTIWAGYAARNWGTRRVITASFLFTLAGLPLLLASNLQAILAGLSIIACGTFFAQAAATGYVSTMSGTNPAKASGLYLASYYCGGLVGSVVLGLTFEAGGWPPTVAALAAALILAVYMSLKLGRSR